MRKARSKRMTLHRETLRQLQSPDMNRAAGGYATATVCPPCPSMIYSQCPTDCINCPTAAVTCPGPPRNC